MDKAMHSEFDEQRAVVLTNIARPIVRDDLVAAFASDEDLLIYEHFFIKGMEHINQSNNGIKQMDKEFEEFNAIIEAIENRCMAVDGPVTPTLQEATEEELSMLWALLKPVQKENQSLRSELQKQKELNTELVEVGSRLINPGILFSEDLFDVTLEKFKSLIKKSKES